MASLASSALAGPKVCPGSALRSASASAAPLTIRVSPAVAGRTARKLQLVCRAQTNGASDGEASQPGAGATAAAMGGILAVSLSGIMALAGPALAANANIRLPPLSQDPKRCERAFVGNTIGQANGVADKLLDLRSCNYANNKTDLKGKTLSAALMSDAVFDNADMTEVVMSKAYAVGASFKAVDFSNAVLDRVVFDGADLTGAKFNNTVLSGSTFDGSELKDADFEDALIGYVDIQKVCRNTTLSDIAKAQLGCR